MNGAQRPAEQRQRSRSSSETFFEIAWNAERRAQHARVEELEERPQLAEVVFHRRAGHGQAVVGPQQPAGLGPLRLGVLDRLGLVEDGVVEADVLELGDVAVRGCRRWSPRGRTGRGAPGRALRSGPGVVQHAELRGEPLGLLDPVEHEAAGHHDQRRRSAGRRRLSAAARRDCSRASTCTVLPRPMSSARQPPRRNSRRKCSQPSPSFW